jgi:hypothetical protein
MKISSAFQTFLADAPDRAKAWIELARGGKRLLIVSAPKLTSAGIEARALAL